MTPQQYCDCNTTPPKPHAAMLRTAVPSIAEHARCIPCCILLDPAYPAASRSCCILLVWPGSGPKGLPMVVTQLLLEVNQDGEPSELLPTNLDQG